MVVVYLFVCCYGFVWCVIENYTKQQPNQKQQKKNNT